MTNYVANVRKIVKPESEWTFGEALEIIRPMVTSKRRMEALKSLGFADVKARLFEAIPYTRECTLRVGTKKYINRQLDNRLEELEQIKREKAAWLEELKAGQRQFQKEVWGVEVKW